MRPFLCDFLRVEGISPHRALDKLAQRGVRVYDAQKAGIAALNFAVRSKDTEKVFAIFSRSCYTVIKTGQSRAKRLLAAVRRRPGFVCGAVLFCLFSFAADRVILRIDVAGSAARYAERAEEVLAAAGLGVFSLYSADAADGARAQLLAAFPGVAFAEVEKSGCVLLVTLEEGDTAEVPVRANELTAPVAGTVEELTVLRGEACVAEGQQVEAGTLLVAGRIVSQDGSYTETFVSARCVLTAEYAYTAAGSGGEAQKLALAQARLSAECELLRGAVSELTVTEERVSESGGEIAVTLTLRLILAANY